MKTEGFKYYAFISYSHKDKKLAKKLQRHLQSYHLPSALLRTNPDLPKKLSPVFMDESNLVASGTLKSALRDNLDNSNYLIVICSPNSAKSEYVNDEVEYFINAGRISHIIPFIIEGVPHSGDESTECFPKAILNLPREHELLGIDMKKFGVRDSFSRVIATLLALELDNFVNYEKRRRARKIIAFSSMAAALMIAAGIFIWKNIIPHYSYYHTYVYRWEKPVGLFEVKESERKKKEYTYRFTTVGGKVKMIERINSAGILVDPTIITPFTELPMIRFVSDRTVEYYDVNGKKIYRKEYTKNFEAVDFYRGDDDLPYALQSETSGYRVNRYNSELGSKEEIGNIIRMTLEHDSNGYLIRKTFRQNNHGGYDQKGVHVQDSKCRGGFSYTVDEIGRVIEVHYLNTQRDFIVAEGIYVEQIEYDKSPYPVKITYLDKKDNLASNSQGIASISITYDEYFNAEKLSYYSANKEHVMKKDEYMSETVFTHDPDKGFLISESFYDTNLAPAIIFRMEFKRDHEGRITERLGWDSKGESITYIQAREMDSLGRVNDAESLYFWGQKCDDNKDYKRASEFYRKSAELGYLPAQYNLGVLYFHGRGVPQDYEQVFYWWNKAAEQGYAPAQHNLGLMYRFGYYVRQDYDQAIYWLQKAAEQGYAESQNILGLIYSEVLEPDYEKAVYWFRKAAEQGLARAQNSLGLMYRYGEGVEKDEEQVLYWWNKAAEQGYAPAQQNLGVYNYAKQDYGQAVYWFQKATEQGYANAQCSLGFMYQNGYGVSQDFGQAIELYRRSVEQGNISALYNMGIIYSNGYGVEKDFKQAAEWFMRAANQGHVNAQCELGFMYIRGYGVEQDFRQAFYWYQKAAERGAAVAQYNLGVMYENGDGVDKNLKEAYMLYYLSYLSGNRLAEEHMKNIEGQLSESEINEAKAQAQKKFNEIKEKDE